MEIRVGGLWILGKPKYVELNGKLVSRKEYCRKTGYNYNSLHYYVKHYNLTWEEAIKRYLEHKNRQKVKNWRLYTIWRGMLGRCTKPNSPSYGRYGGKKSNPITLCDRWLNFHNFQDDMLSSYMEHVEKYGEKDTTIDRIDSNKGYFKENCHWATLKEQANNKSNNKIIAENLTIAQFSEKYNIPYATLRGRLKSGWSIEDIINTPVKNYQIKRCLIPPTGETLKELSKRTGIKVRTIYDRYYKGWSWDKILNTPVNKIVFETGETIQEISEQTGLSASTIKGRYDRGWSLEKIKNTPVNNGKNNNKIILPTGETLTEASIRLNIPRKTLESRLKRGWSLEKTINTPLQIKYRKKC